MVLPAKDTALCYVIKRCKAPPIITLDLSTKYMSTELPLTNYRTKLITVNSVEPKLDLTKQERGIGSEDVLALILFCSTTVLVISISMLPNIWKGYKAKKSAPNHNSQIPCKNCHFFSHNQHLRCTVQPSLVLTEQAFDCSDYRSLNHTKS